MPARVAWSTRLRSLSGAGKPTQQLNATVRDNSFFQALHVINDIGKSRLLDAERRLNGSAVIEHVQEGSPTPEAPKCIPRVLRPVGYGYGLSIKAGTR